MKVFLVTLLVALATGAPLEESNNPVEVIVHGLAEGESLDIGHIVDVKLQEHSDGIVVASSDVLYPLTAEGIAAAVAAEQPVETETVEAPVLPGPVLPGFPQPVPIETAPIVPEAVVVVDNNPGVPEAIEVVEQPEAVESAVPLPVLVDITNPETVVVVENPPEDVVALPEVVIPEDIVIAEQERPNGEIFNNGAVQITVNTPEVGVYSTIHSWFSFVINYFNGPEQTSQQII